MDRGIHLVMRSIQWKKTGPKGTLSTSVVIMPEDSDPNQDRIQFSYSVIFL